MDPDKVPEGNAGSVDSYSLPEERVHAASVTFRFPFKNMLTTMFCRLAVKKGCTIPFVLYGSEAHFHD